MNRPSRLSALRAWFVPVIASLYFLFAGLIFIPYPGLQNDELFFSGPLYYADAAFYAIKTHTVKIPLMVMSYSGALKTWLYAGLFQFVAPDRWSVRVPVVLMGMGTVWLTWVWTRRIAGSRAAGFAVTLLVTDAIFLLTNTFDWGPVALQHLLLMGGLVAVQRWLADGTQGKAPAARWLAIGFFLWGLGLWDKALLIWPLIGLAVACVLAYPRETIRRLKPKNAGIAIACLLAGALPLLIFNVDRRGETASSNAKLTASELPVKVAVLRQTVDGSTLFGYMVYAKSGEFSRAPRGILARTSVVVASRTGSHRRNWMPAAWIAGLICFLGLWGTPLWRPLLFLLIVIGVTWLQMALTVGAGGASHHVILLWPFPPVFLGIAFSGIADRMGRPGPPLATLAIAIFGLGNLLNTNEYLAAFAVNGAQGGWTDAIYKLSDSLDTKTASWIGLVDWGYLNGLRLLHEGDLPLFIVYPDADAAEIRRITSNPDFLFIQHTEDKQIFRGVNDRFRQAADRQGYAEHVERLIYDGNGRPVFEFFRFAPK